MDGDTRCHREVDACDVCIYTHTHTCVCMFMYALTQKNFDERSGEIDGVFVLIFNIRNLKFKRVTA